MLPYAIRMSATSCLLCGKKTSCENGGRKIHTFEDRGSTKAHQSLLFNLPRIILSDQDKKLLASPFTFLYLLEGSRHFNPFRGAIFWCKEIFKFLICLVRNAVIS